MYLSKVDIESLLLNDFVKSGNYHILIKKISFFQLHLTIFNKYKYIII